jgi:NADPH:quinone reductase
LYAGDVTRNESYATHTAVDARATARKPMSFSFAQAAVILFVVETAWESLNEVMCADAGQSILICNGAGGVGSMMIELAKLKDLTNYGFACRTESIKWCEPLGNHTIIIARKSLSRSHLPISDLKVVLTLSSSCRIP